jgi:hypothetical protein
MHPYRCSTARREVDERARPAIARDLAAPYGVLWIASLVRVVWLAHRGAPFGALDTVAIVLLIVVPLLLIERRRHGEGSI